MSETPFPVSAPPPDAASLAALLQSAAQALLRSGTPSDEEHPAPAKVERIQEEIRHYRFPPLAVRCEKELLEAEDAEEMRELLFRAFSSLETFADLLELMNPEAKVEGVVMHTLARDCGVSADWCSRSKTLTAPWSLWKHSPTTAIQITKRITQKALSDKPPRAFFQHTGKTGESHPYRRRGKCLFQLPPERTPSGPPSPPVKSLGKGGGSGGRDNLSSERFPFPRHVAPSPNYLSAGTGWSKPSSGRKGSSSMTVG